MKIGFHFLLFNNQDSYLHNIYKWLIGWLFNVRWDVLVYLYSLPEKKIQAKNKGNAKHGISPRLKIRPCDLDLWPWKSIGFQILLRSKYVPSLLILECSQGSYAVKIRPGDIDLWPMTLKFNRVPDSAKDYACTKFGQNPLKDLDSSVHKDTMQ